MVAVGAVAGGAMAVATPAGSVQGPASVPFSPPSTAPAPPPPTARAPSGSLTLKKTGQVAVPGLSPDAVAGVPGNDLVVLLTNSGLAAVNTATQQVAWTAPLGGSSGQKEATVVDGLVLTAPATDSGVSTLEAFDAASGSPRWSVPGWIGPENPPGAVLVDGALVTLSSAGLTGIDPVSGGARWTSPAGGSPPFFPIATDGRRVFTGTALGGRLAAYLVGTAKLAWTARSGAGSLGALAVGDGTVAAVVTATNPEAPSRLVAYDTTDGHRRWSARLPAAWDFVNPPMVVGDRLIVASGGPGAGESIDAYDLRSGHRLWHRTLASAYLTVAAGGIAASTGTQLAILDPASGTVRGQVSEPLVASGPVYAVGDYLAVVGQGTLYLYSTST